MKAQNVLAKLALLETKYDLLETELDYLNRLLMRCGFSDGLESFKATVESLLREERDAEPFEE